MSDLKIDKNGINEWIKKGAQPTETVQYLISNTDENGNWISKPEVRKKISKKAKAKMEAENKEENPAA